MARASGDMTITPAPSVQRRSGFGGPFKTMPATYNSFAYSFVVDSNVSFPVQYEVYAKSNPDGGEGIGDAGIIFPGRHEYRATFAGRTTGVLTAAVSVWRFGSSWKRGVKPGQGSDGGWDNGGFA